MHNNTSTGKVATKELDICSSFFFFTYIHITIKIILFWLFGGSILQQAKYIFLILKIENYFTNSLLKSKYIKISYSKCRENKDLKTPRWPPTYLLANYRNSKIILCMNAPSVDNWTQTKKIHSSVRSLTLTFRFVFFFFFLVFFSFFLFYIQYSIM